MLTTNRISEFSLIYSQWEELHRQSQTSSVFTSFNWQTTWWEFFGDQAELILLAVYDGDSLIAIAPLMRHDDCISFVGGRAVSDMLDFITYPGYEVQVATEVVSYLCNEKWNSILLRGLKESTPSISVFISASQQLAAQVSLIQEDVSPVADLHQTWDAQLASMSKKDRHELRRKLRRLDESVCWRWYSLSGADAGNQEINDFLRLMRLSNIQKADFMTAKMEQFFRTVLRPLIENQIARFYFLEIDGQRVAATICFDQREELWLYNSGFDPTYSPLSVGLLLKALCLKDAIERGKYRFDFLRGAEPYKYDLGAHDHPLYYLRLTRADAVSPDCYLDETAQPKEI